MATIENPSSGKHRLRFEALDILRLVAVLGVVLFHYGFRGPAGLDGANLAWPELSIFARYGFLGVPIFFVISGFVIAYSAEGRTATEFAIARVTRIYPGYLICMSLTFLTVLTLGAQHFSTSGAQWLANLFIAAPALRQPYMDSAYWSLVVEVTFYAWVAGLIATGLFRRHIDAIVMVWLAISMLNELTIDARAVEWIFLADDSGFFATGIMIYQLRLGRRDVRMQLLLAVSVATALYQAVHNLAWLSERSGTSFDDWVVAAICLASILVIIRATRVRSLPLPAGLALAIGGMTYPLYLLHQQIGYVLLRWVGPVSEPAALTALILAGIALLSLAIWRFVERPCQRMTRQWLTIAAARLGWAQNPRAVGARLGPAI